MYRLSKILIVLVLLVAVVMLFQKRTVIHVHRDYNNHLLATIHLNGVSIDEIEYDSCLGALKCIKENDLKGFKSFYLNNNINSLTSAVADMKLIECSKWFNQYGIIKEAKSVRIDSIYGYTDDNGSIIDNATDRRDKERITYITFLFPSKQAFAHTSKLLTFEFTDKISTDHFINWWAKDI